MRPVKEIKKYYPLKYYAMKIDKILSVFGRIYCFHPQCGCSLLLA
jgi:hypothetical protein